MVDVRGNDRAACCDLRTDELCGDLLRDALGEAAENRGGVGTARTLATAGMLLVEFVSYDVAVQLRELGLLGAAHVLTDCDELHLRGDDALARIPELGDGMPGGSPARFALCAGESGELNQAVPLGGAGILGMFPREVAIVHRLDFATLVGGGVTAFPDPVLAEGWKSLGGVAIKVGIPPRATAVVNADRIIGLQITGEVLGRGEFDLAHRDAHFGMDAALDIDACARGQGVGA